MPNIRAIASTVSTAPEMYIQVAAGLNPAATKKLSVAGTVNLATICGMRKAPQMMRKILNSFRRLKLSAIDILPPRVFRVPNHRFPLDRGPLFDRRGRPLFVIGSCSLFFVVLDRLAREPILAEGI